jgi:hypothetical protein
MHAYLSRTLSYYYRRIPHRLDTLVHPHSGCRYMIHTTPTHIASLSKYDGVLPPAL